ncbi:MAG: methyltransferase domain-containing protein [Myxococcales bacterium]|nr:MAG: methyltransferase domain-containing protein [Myxococcales bacterium]
MGDTGQVTSSAAEFYEEFFVPALFGEWVPRVLAAADLSPGMRVADVACGTGLATLAAAEAVSPGGSAVGVDLNPGMLAVARRKAGDIEWHEAPAEALPFKEESFDAVVSQFGLMFFADKKAAISEMWRVLRPGGRLVVAVWGSLHDAPGYAAMTALLSSLFGDAISDLLKSPYSLGETDTLRGVFCEAGVDDLEIQRVAGQARFASVRAWVECDVRGWTLADKLDDDQFELLVAEAEKELHRFVAADGSVAFAHPALIASAVKLAK